MNLSDLLGVASRQTTASLSLPFDHSSCTRLVDPQTKHIGPQIEFFLRLTEAAETLRAILKDNHLMRTAVNVEPENMQMDMLTSAMATVREDEEVRQPIEEKIGRVVRKRLSGFADTFTQVTEVEGDVIEGQVKQIEAPRQRKPRGEFLQRQEELRQSITDHPGVTVREIAAHFGKSKYYAVVVRQAHDERVAPAKSVLSMRSRSANRLFFCVCSC